MNNGIVTERQRGSHLRHMSGNASDVTTAPTVLAEAPCRIQRLAADKGYDADRLRADLRETRSRRSSGQARAQAEDPP